MSRIVFNKGKQKEFLNKVHYEAGLSWLQMANICDIGERTLRDWRNEKFYMKYEAAKLLSEKTSVSFCTPKKILPDYWSTKKAGPIGAKTRYEIYGNPGTPEGRRRGGISTQNKFLNDLNYSGTTGFKLRKIIKIPKPSSKLAEFIGIILGDGGMTDHQVTVSYNRETDGKHARYVQELIIELFGISSSIISSKSSRDKSDNIVISSKNLVEFLISNGLKIGNKIRNEIDIPDWIKNKLEYKVACLRGLIDTDGSFYAYKHKVNAKSYNSFAICFTNHAANLLIYVYDILKELEFRPSQTKWRVYLYRKNDLERYVNLIGSNNPKHLDKYSVFKGERYGSGYNRAVLKTA